MRRRMEHRCLSTHQFAVSIDAGDLHISTAFHEDWRAGILIRRRAVHAGVALFGKWGLEHDRPARQTAENSVSNANPVVAELDFPVESVVGQAVGINSSS